MFLSVGATIVSGQRSSASLLFSNGSSVSIRPGTQVKVEQFFQTSHNERSISRLAREPSRSNTKLNLAFGELIGNTKSLQTGSTFDIETPVGIAGIRGTNWFLRVVQLASGAFNVVFGIVDGSGFFTPDEVGAVGVQLQDGKQIEIKLEFNAATGTPQITVSGLQNVPSSVADSVNAIVATFNEQQRIFDAGAVEDQEGEKQTFDTTADPRLQSPTRGG